MWKLIKQGLLKIGNFFSKKKSVVSFNDVYIGELPEIGEKPIKTIGDLIKEQAEVTTPLAPWKDPQQSKEDVA